MHRCDLTGVSCEGREKLSIPCNAPFWVSPVVKLLLLQGKSLREIKEMQQELEDKLKTFDSEQRQEFFNGSNIKVV